MTALSSNFQRPIRIPPGGLRMARVLLAGYTNYDAGNASFTVHKGALMMCDISDTDGYFSPIHGTPGAGDLFGGVALDAAVVDSSVLADGAIQITVLASGIIGIPKGSLAITDLGATIFATDDGTGITTATTGGIPIGKLEEVDDVYAWIDIENAFMGVKA